MTIFIYGEDKYRARQKIGEIKDNFLKTDKSVLNLISFDEDNFDWPKIQEAILANTFFSDKKLVILKNVLSKGQKDLQEKLAEILDKKQIAKEFIVIFWEQNKIDSRKKLFKKLQKADQVLVFNLLNFTELNNWIAGEVQKRGGLIDKMTINKLANFVGPDLFRLNNEIDKLIAYTSVGEGGKRQILAADVDLLVSGKLEENIFNFTESLGRGNKKMALKLMHEILVSDNDPNFFIAMMAFLFRNMIKVKDLASRNLNQYEIAKEAKIHPYAALKSLDACKNFEMSDLKNIYDKIFKLERELKNGSVDIKLAMDRFIVEM